MEISKFRDFSIGAQNNTKHLEQNAPSQKFSINSQLFRICISRVHLRLYFGTLRMFALKCVCVWVHKRGISLLVQWNVKELSEYHRLRITCKHPHYHSALILIVSSHRPPRRRSLARFYLLSSIFALLNVYFVSELLLVGWEKSENNHNSN